MNKKLRADVWALVLAEARNRPQRVMTFEEDREWFLERLRQRLVTCNAARSSTTDSNAVGHHHVEPVGLTDVIYDPVSGVTNYIIRDVDQ